MANDKEKPRSLVQYFEADEDYQGHFGWVCGYSADASFMNEAAERFTGETEDRRAARGNIALALILDRGNPPISMVDVPGVAHLPFKELTGGQNKLFRLMHAKVALLGFRHRTEDQWILRLIVSTGNWTRQTLEDSLDLVWCIKIDSETYKKKTTRQKRADIYAAWSLFEFLCKHHASNILKAGENTTSGGPAAAAKDVKKWIADCCKLPRNGVKPRFIDNRNKSLLDQLPDAIAPCAERNYLAMGSGFFEGVAANGNGAMPSVLNKIVDCLKNNKQHLRDNPTVDVFVNPSACQAMATALANKPTNWHVRPPANMDNIFGKATRALHAKFLFSCTGTEGDCQNAWVYLGSGNLTNPGFIQKAGQDGNLEAGVVFSPEGLKWPADLLTNYLPIQRETEITQAQYLNQGNGMPARTDFVAPPIAWFDWEPYDSSTGGCLKPASLPNGTTISVLKPDNSSYIKIIANGVQWDAPQPREVTIQWDNNGKKTARIPVLDPFGRLAATPHSPRDFADVWWDLENFPGIESEDEEDDSKEPKQKDTGTGGTSNQPDTGTYPIRQMMELIERIAEHQTKVREADWRAWCARLEQTLYRIENSEVVKYFRETLELNPLCPLMNSAFRPDYAEDNQKPHGDLYEKVLATVAVKWKTNKLRGLGEDA